jgi:hypothetical protein
VRVLLTSLPIRSHLMPTVVPLARAFRAKGHEAVIATGPAMGHVENTVVMPGIPAPSDFGPPPPWVPERDGTLDVPLWAEELVARAVANILEFARTWRPDVILRETSEYGGQIAAEVLGIPHGLVDIAPFAPLEIQGLDERKDEVRARFGAKAAEPCFTAGLTPAFWHPAQHHYRVPVEQGSWERAPEIVATFGTNADLLMTGSRLPHVVVEAAVQRPARTRDPATGAAQHREGVRDTRGLQRRAGGAHRRGADGGPAAVRRPAAQRRSNSRSESGSARGREWADGHRSRRTDPARAGREDLLRHGWELCGGDRRAPGFHKYSGPPRIRCVTTFWS